MKEHNSVILMSFECARRGKKKVFACCNVQNEVRRPSMTDSGGQDGAFGGANTGQKEPKRGVKSPHSGGQDRGGAEPEDQGPKREDTNYSKIVVIAVKLATVCIS